MHGHKASRDTAHHLGLHLTRSDWDIDTSLNGKTSARSDWVIDMSLHFADITTPRCPLTATVRTPPHPLATFLAPRRATASWPSRSSHVPPAMPPWRHWCPWLATASHTTMASLALIQASRCWPRHHGTANAPLQSAGVGKHHYNASKEEDDARRRRRRLAGRSDMAFAGACPHPAQLNQRALKSHHPCPPPLPHATTTASPPAPASPGRIRMGGSSCSRGMAGSGGRGAGAISRRPGSVRPPDPP